MAKKAEVELFDEEAEFENKISRLLAILQTEREYLPGNALELIDWIEDWFEAKN